MTYGKFHDNKYFYYLKMTSTTGRFSILFIWCFIVLKEYCADNLILSHFFQQNALYWLFQKQKFRY